MPIKLNLTCAKVNETCMTGEDSLMMEVNILRTGDYQFFHHIKEK